MCRDWETWTSAAVYHYRSFLFPVVICLFLYVRACSVWAWQKKKKKKVFDTGCGSHDIWKPSITCVRSAARVALTAKEGHRKLTLLERKALERNWRRFLCLPISWTRNKLYSGDLQEPIFICSTIHVRGKHRLFFLLLRQWMRVIYKGLD